MRIALFGGSFDPVHNEHIRLVRAAIGALSLDRVIVMPSYLAPHKAGGARASGEERLQMCRIAFSGVPEAEVSDYELAKEGTSYSYLTCRWLEERFPDAERYFLVGADMLESFFHWYRPEEILERVTLAACGREREIPAELHDCFRRRFGHDFTEFAFVGEEVSSTELRVALAFPAEVRGEIREMDGGVLAYLAGRQTYRYPEQERALELEKPERRAHSYRVARMACGRARSLGIPEEQALIAAMLHDCGKYVSLSSPLLAGFKAPSGVPEPVLHQYTGAYLAEHVFSVHDEEVLNAIRFHTSGREGMSCLEKLIFLADLLEEGRSFEGVEALRMLFRRDLDQCLLRALEQQLIYLNRTGKPVFPLTERAYQWILAEQNAKN